MVDRDLGPETVANWGQLYSTEAIRDGSLERTTRTSLTYRDAKQTKNIKHFIRSR